MPRRAALGFFWLLAQLFLLLAQLYFVLLAQLYFVLLAQLYFVLLAQFFWGKGERVMEFGYSLNFGPVGVGRGEMVLEMERLLRRLGAWPEGLVRRLALVESEGGGSRFEYVGESMKGQDLGEILEASRGWDGVHLGLSYELSSCGLLVLSDGSGEGGTALTLRMDAGPMYARRNHPWHAGRLFALVADTTEDLGSEFAVFEGAWSGRVRTLADVDLWLDMVEGGEQTGWEWVLMRESGVAFEEVGEEIGEFASAQYGLERYEYRQMWVASRWPYFRAAQE